MKCEYCNKEHDGAYASGRFCSKECARGFSSREKRKEINIKVSKTLTKNKKWSLKQLEPKSCLNCGATIKNARIYCSNQCQQDYRKKQYTLSVEKNGKFPNLTSDSGARVRLVKRYLIEKNGHKCSICGGTKWFNNLMPLWVDHIDGQGDNWEISNIRLVCPNCDFFSSTYCGRNKGKGRRNPYKRL